MSQRIEQTVGDEIQPLSAGRLVNNFAAETGNEQERVVSQAINAVVNVLRAYYQASNEAGSDPIPQRSEEFKRLAKKAVVDLRNREPGDRPFVRLEKRVGLSDSELETIMKDIQEVGQGCISVRIEEGIEGQLAKLKNAQNFKEIRQVIEWFIKSDEPFDSSEGSLDSDDLEDVVAWINLIEHSALGDERGRVEYFLTLLPKNEWLRTSIRRAVDATYLQESST